MSTRPIYIEIPETPEKEISEKIQSLLLVNRTVDNSYSDFHIDSLQRLFYRKNFNYDTIIGDLQAVDTMLKATGDLLYESGRFDIVIPENRFLKFNRNAFMSSTLQWDEASELCETYDTDAIVSVDHLKMRVSTGYDVESFYDAFQNSFRDVYLAEMKVIYESLIRIYYPAEQTVVYREIMKDTLFWEDIDVDVSDLFRRFTPVKTALVETGIAVALDFSDKISTSWHVEKRTIFTNGNKNLARAYNFIRENDWETAIQIWKEMENSDVSKSLRSKAQFNIAVGYELMGDTEQAILWAVKSYETMFRTQTYNYMEILKQRRNKIKTEEE